MAERQTGPIEGRYSNREEYQLGDAAARKYLKNEVLEDVDELLEARRAETQSPYHLKAYEDGLWVRDLQLSARDAIVQTDAAVRVAHFREGMLEQSTEVTLREFVRNARIQFVSQYTIEQFRNGGFQAVHTTHDPEHYDVVDQQQMTPYDFEQMAKTIRAIKAMQHYELLKDQRIASLRERGFLK